VNVAARLKVFWKRRHWWVLGLAVLLTAGASVGAVRLSRSAPNVPTADVRRGEFVEYAQFRGEAKALKSIVLTGPARAGDLQIVKLPANGAAVKEGDIVVEFDTAKIRQTLDQKRSELKQVEAEIEQARATARLTEEQDRTNLTKARYDVERARLDASKQEILSEIEGKKNKLVLADTEQALRESEQKKKSDQASDAASIADKQHKLDKALFDVREAERQIAAMTLRAPVSGLVTILPNWRARLGFSDSAPPFRLGDRAWPGALILELPDMSTLRVRARVDETDRGRLKPGQLGTIRIDAVPDQEFTGTLVSISPLAKADFSSWPIVRNFDVEVQIEKVDPRVRPGMSTTMRIAIDRRPDSILVPAQAVFEKAGRTVAYALHGSRFEERDVEVARRGDSECVVTRGLAAGERVATKDPTQKR
jgi:HlyD family secretion protein